MTGSYITHDGGRTWRMFNLRGVVDFFAFDPRDPKTLYANATGLWRSTDGGEKWNLVYPSPSSIKGIKMDSDHSDETILADPDPLGTIAALGGRPSEFKNSLCRNWHQVESGALRLPRLREDLAETSDAARRSAPHLGRSTSGRSRGNYSSRACDRSWWLDHAGRSRAAAARDDQ